MRIQGEGSALKLTFACPDPNDHELRAFLKSDIDARAPDFMFHPEQAIAQFPWKWGRSFLWVTPHGYMEMGMVVQRTGPKWHQAINTPKGFGSYLEDMTRREMDKEKTAVHHPGDGYPLWLDLPEETPLNSVLWLCQHIRMSNSSIPDSRYFLAVDESRYLIIYFNFNDETGLSGVRSDWVARAQAMIEKIMATMKAEYEMSGPDSALSHP